MHLSTAIKIRIVLLYAEFRSISQVQRALKAENFNQKPTDKTIKEVYKRFSKTGSIADLPRSGRPKKYGQNEKSSIETILDEKPQSTLSEISASVGMSRTTISRYIHEEMSAKSYKIQIHQGLYEEDHDRRVQTAEELLPYLNDPSLENLIFFSDEATFHVSGYVHKQNCRIWSTEKPTEVYEHWDNTPKINVWCAMSSDRIIGPYFFEENVKGQNYLHMLENFFWPYIQNKRLASKIMFQQDGAAAHYSLNVRNWLDDRLPGRWIGRRGPIEWAARSPDLTPLDFFLWGYIKQMVYKRKHNNLDQLRDSITNAIKSIKPDVLHRVFREISKRMNLVIEKKGAHIEQYL